MSQICLTRLKADLSQFYNNPPFGIHLHYQENNFTEIHALIIGPKDTPYEGGFFYFILNIPFDYPMNPPKVTLQTTGLDAGRFDPNLYNCGKVCLSILGSWSGSGWSPDLSILTVLISIQSSLNEEYYYNEQGYGSDEYYKAVCNKIIYAVGDMLDRSTPMPNELFDIAKHYFLKNYYFYTNVCQKYPILHSQFWRLDELCKKFLKLDLCDELTLMDL